MVRVIDGKEIPAFWPHAGFSTKFLKHGSPLDLAESVKTDNILSLLAAGRDNIDLTRYLIGQGLQLPGTRLEVLKGFVPMAKRNDWRLEVAGQRVQIIKKDPVRGGVLQFGTEVVSSAGLAPFPRSASPCKERRPFGSGHFADNPRLLQLSEEGSAS